MIGLMCLMSCAGNVQGSAALDPGLNLLSVSSLTFFNIRFLKTKNPLIKTKPGIKNLLVLSDKFSQIVCVFNQMTLITPMELATFSPFSLVNLHTNLDTN